MKKIVIFYGSTTGRTEGVAEKIAEKLGVPSSNVYSASDIKKVDIGSYDVFILGSSTWGDGELQDDWYDAIEVLKKENLKDKIVALFGCGDSYSYEDTFCDAMGILYKELENTGCRFCGAVSTDGYGFSSSSSVVDGKFVGLALDEENEDNKTDERIDNWVEELKKCIE
ncbi:MULTISPECIES: flavodoxin FldA [Bacteroidales]|jgi:flavodoxin|uniref:flavodoxin FldA n=1 Tax=Bacteroidales TaxID=171549 RepID=UPI0005755DC0|nr:flavodoxin FldA [Gabonia massiliensis]KHM44274.1 flavodoxin [Coprobacter secundus]